MTNAEMIRRIEMVQDMMASSGTGWGRIVIELGKDGEPKHINYTLEMIPEKYRGQVPGVSCQGQKND